MTQRHYITTIALALAIAILAPLCGEWGVCRAQKDPDAVHAAMTLLIRRHSVNADTIAVELSHRFRHSAPMQTALARAYFRNNDRQKTRLYLAKAIEADDKYAPAYLLHGEMFGEWEVDSAAYWFQKAIEAQPTDPDGYIRYANVMARRDMEKAKEKLQELKKAVPSYNINVELAALYNKQGDDKLAAEAMAGTDLESLSAYQMAQYLQNCYWANDDARGMEVGAVAMERFPGNRGFCRVYAWCAARSGHDKEAIEQGTKWLERAPADSINAIDYLSLGRAYLGTGDVAKAFDTWQRIKDLKDDYYAPQMKGQITRIVSRKVTEAKEFGDYDMAADMYHRLIHEYPSDTDPAYQLYSLAQIYREQQDTMEGEEKLECIKRMFTVYSEIEEQYPRWENIHYVLYTHARWTYSYFDPENEQQLAEPYYQRLYNTLQGGKELTQQQQTMIVEACQYMASTEYFQRQDVTMARKWWSRILTYDPDNETAKEALAKIRK